MTWADGGAPVFTSLWQRRGQCITLHLEFILKLSHENESNYRRPYVETRVRAGAGTVSAFGVSRFV